jgi:hypothetical protein
MRAATIKVIFWIAFGFMAMFAFALMRREPWHSLSFGLLLVACIMLLYAVRDVVHAICMHLDVNISKAAIFTHVCAGTMAAGVYFVTFFDSDPRLDSVRWPLLILMPLSVYLLSYLYDSTGSSAGSRTPEKRSRKRPPAP